MTKVVHLILISLFFCCLWGEATMTSSSSSEVALDIYDDNITTSHFPFLVNETTTSLIQMTRESFTRREEASHISSSTTSESSPSPSDPIMPVVLPLTGYDDHDPGAICHPIFAFDTVGPYRQEEARSHRKEKIYYYRSTDTSDQEQSNSILTKDEFGLVCFTKMINCTTPQNAITSSSRKTPGCVYFEKEFCTRLYGQMRWKGAVCEAIKVPHQEREYICPLRNLGGSGGVDHHNTHNKSLICRNTAALCLSLKPPFHTRSGSSDRNPPTQTVCLCPLGFTGSSCGKMDIDLIHLDLLHNVDLRNILLKYQQKDRYFIGVTLLFLLIVTLFSVLLVVASCSFLFYRIVPKFRTSNKTTNDDDFTFTHHHHDHHRFSEEEDEGHGLRPRKSTHLMTIMGMTISRGIRAGQTFIQRCFPDDDDDDYCDHDLELRFEQRRRSMEMRRERLGGGSGRRGIVSVGRVGGVVGMGGDMRINV